MWLETAVIYQVYVRSFQDSDADGVGDLRGVIARLGHVAGLGAGAIWLSPIYPSPNADFGYDVSDHTSVDPALGTLADFEELVERAHALGLRVILDFVPCHTSIEHPWFRRHPDYYVWADAPANNWRASFGGSVWELDPVTGRYYLHSFFPEQADLDWHNPAVREEVSRALRVWLERGVDGFRLDALDRILKDERLRDDPEATEPPALPLHPEYGRLRHVHSGNVPEIGAAIQSIRDAVGDAILIGEVYLPGEQLGPYLRGLDAAFAFDVMQAEPTAAAIRSAIAAGLAAGKPGWVLSNHDFSRLPNRYGPENARAMTLLLLSLPGPAFVFQGDELGLRDAHPDRQLDRHGRDGFRAPMPWDETRNGGFTAGEPWLGVGDGVTRSVAEQERDPDSHLGLVRRLIAQRPALGGEAELIDSAPGVVAIRRGEHVIAVNLAAEPRPAPPHGPVVIEARPGDGREPGSIPAHGGWIATDMR